MKAKTTKSILVAISSAHAASRQKLRGIYRYAAHKIDWDITLVRSSADITAQLLDECATGVVDGFILSSDECSAEIGRTVPLDKPLVAIEVIADIIQKRDKRKSLLLTTDNAAIGRMAAEHFRSLGRFASFAYIPDEHRRKWSDIRGRAFLEAASSNGGHSETFDSSQETISEFLSRLEQPIAVLAAWDFLAAKVIKACHTAGLSVPTQVSVLGIDDDDLICESVHPPLSTILVDRMKQGFIAAKMLDAMMNSRKLVTNYICRPIKVVQRESTAHVQPGIAIVERARQFIADHALEAISVDNVADALHVSRRLLDLRFAESGLGSVSATIRNKKLAEVKRLLKQTSLSDTRIAARCGFKNVGTLRNLFRNTYGISLRTYHSHGK